MNKLLSKKKAPEPITTNNVASHGPKSPQLNMKSSGSRWKKSKKQPEPQPDLNFDLALPSNDDFRTSLLMNNLSARFSMLREQDDPKSLIGKASDDSVLAPRRRSRLGDFGFSSNGLNDIAEIQSINGSIRPPFANEGGPRSLGSEDGYGSENDSTAAGSIMGRARRGEGNNLFGGRQKIYRIPTSGANSTKSGKAIYEDDLGMSAFQRYRKNEREERFNRPSEDSSGFDFGLDSSETYDHDYRNDHTPVDSAKDLSHSPSFSAYNNKRSTNSSMARSEARSSTAATSIASQSAVTSSSPLTTHTQTVPAPSVPSMKNRRLYEQGLDQSMQDQQSSAMTRLNSIQRQRAINPPKQSPPTLTSPQKGGRNFNERIQYANYPNSGPQSPTAGSFGPFRQPSLSGIQSKSNGLPSPTSPVMMEFEENSTLNKALEPNDRGKATAMGAFNKPKHQFDESQYLERQHQLLRSQSKAGSPNETTGAAMARQRPDHLAERERSNSDASTRSRSQSLPKKYEPSKAYNLFQSAANQMPTGSGAQGPDRSSQSSEDENGDGQNTYGLGFAGTGRGWQPNTLPSVSEHPALRAQNSRVPATGRQQDPMPSYMKPANLESINPAPTSAPRFPAMTEPVDSPTLGNTNGPLNGMMQHLRSKSDVSSVYGNEDVGLPGSPGVNNSPRRDRTNLDFDRSAYMSANPWTSNELENPYTLNDPRPSVSPIDDGHATPQAGATSEYHDVSPETEMPAMPWDDASRKSHAREASSATQLERDAFADELAARRTAIQENMKSLAEKENHSRGVSPARSTNSAFKSFGIPKSKSRESITNRRDQGHEPMPPLRSKIFGGGASANGSNVDLQYDNSGSSVDTRSRDTSTTRMNINQSRNNSSTRAPAPAVQTRTLNSSEWDRSRARAGSETSFTEHRQMASRRSPATSQGPRSRSNSSTTGTGRSRSRTGPYRDDLQRAMMEGMGSSAAGHPEISPMIANEAAPRVSPIEAQGQQNGNQDKWPTMNNYFDPKATAPNQTAGPRGPATGPEYTILENTVYSPPLGSSGRPTPMTSPFMPNTMTPPMSSSMSGSPFASPPVQPQMRKGTLRKKTISKSDISEPTLISSTSNVDTVDLPPGASLKNGMDEVPPIPPMNQKRKNKGKIFGRNRSASTEIAAPQQKIQPSHPEWPTPGIPPEVPRGIQNNGHFDSTPRYDALSKMTTETHGSPTFNEYGYGPTSPERRQQADHNAGVIDGGMF